MKSNKGFAIFVTVFNAFAILFAFASCLYVSIFFDNLCIRIACVLAMVAVVASAVYFIRGFKKEVAGYYKWYMILYAFSALFFNMIGVYAPVPHNLISVFLGTLVFGCIVLLFVGKDLGEKNACSVCAVIVAAELLDLFDHLIFFHAFAGGGTETDKYVSLILGAQVFLATIAGLMTAAKYVDKENRGTR